MKEGQLYACLNAPQCKRKLAWQQKRYQNPAIWCSVCAKANSQITVGSRKRKA